MWLKGTLFIIGAVVVLHFGECRADSEETPSSSTIDPDTLDYDRDQLDELIMVFDEAASWPIGKRGQECTSDADCSTYIGTKCFGFTGCKRCICDPFEYDFVKNDLDDWLDDATESTERYRRRSFYDNDLSKCLKVLLIDDTCEHDDQCPTDGGQRKCDTSTKKCICKEDNDVPVTGRLSCQQPGYKQTCDTTRGCRTGLACEGDSTKKCECDESLYWFDNSGSVGDDAADACKRHFWDETCNNNDNHCDPDKGTHDKEQILTCSDSNKCECNPDFYILNGAPSRGATGTSACKKVIIGDDGCNGKDGVCYGGHPSYSTSSGSHTKTTMCATNTCKCREEYPHKVNDQSCRNYAYNQEGCNTRAGSADEVEDFTDTPSKHNERCGGLSANLVCGSGDNENNRCICENENPKWDSGTSTCRELNIAESGCKRALTGWLVETYADTDGNERCNRGFCDVGGNADGVCRCRETAPMYNAATSTTSEFCSLIMVGQTGCKTNLNDNTEDYTDDTEDYRCYDGSGVSTTTTCDGGTTKGTCKCDSTHPTPDEGNESCRKSRWNEDCDAEEDCATGFTCTSLFCKCKNDDKYYEDENQSSAVKQGKIASEACRRIHIEESGKTCTSPSHCETNENDIASPGDAVCTGGTCKCDSGYKHIGSDVCDLEHVHGNDCGSATDNAIICASNMTCTSQKCACEEANNEYDQVKKACRHEDSSYTVGADVACTHDMYDIRDLAYPGGSVGDRVRWTQTPAVKQCGDGQYLCESCDGTKKCRGYSAPISPYQSYAARPEMFLSAMILLVIVAIALV